MFIVHSGTKLNTNPNGEGTSKDSTDVSKPSPAFTDMNTMPSETASLLQERFWGGVNKTNFVNYLFFLKIYLFIFLNTKKLLANFKLKNYLLFFRTYYCCQK